MHGKMKLLHEDYMKFYNFLITVGLFDTDDDVGVIRFIFMRCCMVLQFYSRTELQMMNFKYHISF